MQGQWSILPVDAINFFLRPPQPALPLHAPALPTCTCHAARGLAVVACAVGYSILCCICACVCTLYIQSSMRRLSCGSSPLRLFTSSLLAVVSKPGLATHWPRALLLWPVKRALATHGFSSVDEQIRKAKEEKWRMGSWPGCTL